VGDEMVTYEKNYLINVIFKLNYTSLSDYNNKLKEFQKLIKEKFPILEEAKGVMIEHQFGDKQEVKSKKEDLVKWIFFNRKKTRMLSIESDSLTLEFKEYKNFSEFEVIVKLILESLFGVFSSISSTRLGLRYINQIELNEGEPFKWEGYINNSLLCSLDFIREKEEVSRYITSYVLNREDYQLRIQCGIANSLYPSRIIKKEFILDFDCFTQESLEKEDILRKTKEFNEAIRKLFEESIGEKLRTEMGKIKDE